MLPALAGYTEVLFIEINDIPGANPFSNVAVTDTSNSVNYWIVRLEVHENAAARIHE